MTKILLIMLPVSLLCMGWLQDNEMAKSKERGKKIYEELCITCHLEDGTGTTGVFPPLAQADYLMKKRSEAIHAVKFGQDGEVLVNGVSYNSIMPAPGLTAKEVADVMNYIQNSWGNKAKYVSVEEVEKIKE